MNTRAWGLALVLTGIAPAWAATPADAPAKDKDIWSNEKDACRELPPASSTRLGLIRQMLVAGKPHAAIAYLDASHITAPQADLLRADALRQTGRAAEADKVYRQLLGSCVKGYAYQGLGLSASAAGKTRDAVAQLQAASVALPVDPAVRNDYGYALMQAGNTQAALHEFLTAIELAPNQRRPARNLLLLLTRSGEDEKARAFAQQFGISDAELAGIRELAQQQLPAQQVPEATAPAEGAQNDRNDTGANDDVQTQLAGDAAASRHDSPR